jgi:sulfur-carrier protein
MIRIHVKLFATLRRFLPTGTPNGKAVDLEFPDGTTIGDLVDYFKIPPDEMKVTFVNGRAQEVTCVLADEDEIGMFPPIGGG